MESLSQEHYSLLKINGYVVGVYLAQEKIDKVMLREITPLLTSRFKSK